MSSRIYQHQQEIERQSFALVLWRAEVPSTCFCFVPRGCQITQNGDQWVESPAWSFFPVIIALGMWGQENREFKVSIRWRTQGNENIGGDGYVGKVAGMPCAPGSG